MNPENIVEEETALQEVITVVGKIAAVAAAT